MTSMVCVSLIQIKEKEYQYLLILNSLAPNQLQHIHLLKVQYLSVRLALSTYNENRLSCRRSYHCCQYKTKRWGTDSPSRYSAYRDTCSLQPRAYPRESCTCQSRWSLWRI